MVQLKHLNLLEFPLDMDDVFELIVCLIDLSRRPSLSVTGLLNYVPL